MFSRFEYQEVRLFQNLEIQGSHEILFRDLKEVESLKDAPYVATKGTDLFRFSEVKKKASDFSSFEDKISNKFVEKLDILSSLPTHKVCLINKNKIEIMGSQKEPDDSDLGVAVIIQEGGGYNFSARINKKDCKNVIIDKFKENPSRIEFTYPFVLLTSLEEYTKQQAGKEFVAKIATSTVNTDDTKMVISLNLWVVLVFYLIILPAWSVFFFQYEKIWKYMRNKEADQ